jgi:hypothetical protein
MTWHALADAPQLLLHLLAVLHPALSQTCSAHAAFKHDAVASDRVISYTDAGVQI